MFVEDFLNDFFSEPLEAIMSKLQCLSLPKNSYLLKEGQICREIYFIESGLLKSYYTKNGVNINNWFMQEGDAVLSVYSFYSQKHSYENIQAVEDCSLRYITSQDLYHLYNTFPGFDRFGRLLTEKYYLSAEERLYHLRKSTAKEKYQWFIQRFPGLIQRLKQGEIASFLGMSQETLSRLRAKDRKID